METKKLYIKKIIKFHCITFILKKIFVLFVPLKNSKTLKREGHVAKKTSQVLLYLSTYNRNYKILKMCP